MSKRFGANRHVNNITTYIKGDSSVDTPTIMQVTYAKEVASFLGIEDELNSLEYNKGAYTKFLGKYTKEYKILKKMKEKENENREEGEN